MKLPLSLFSANLGNAVCSTWSKIIGGMKEPLSIESYKSLRAAVIDCDGTIELWRSIPEKLLPNYAGVIVIVASSPHTFLKT